MIRVWYNVTEMSYVLYNVIYFSEEQICIIIYYRKSQLNLTASDLCFNYGGGRSSLFVSAHKHIHRLAVYALIIGQNLNYHNINTERNAAMKKSIILLCVILVSVAFVCSCQTKTPVALELGCGSDGEVQGVHNSEYDLWSNDNRAMHSDDTASQTATIAFNDKTYTGTYWYSTVLIYCNYQSDYYQMDNGWFALNHETGELVTFLCPSSQELSDDPYSLEETRKIADEFVSKYITLSDYTVTDTEREYVNGHTYVKYIDGMKTADSVTIGVSPIDGEVVSFGALELNQFDGSISQKSAKTLSDSTPALVDAKVKSIYSGNTAFTDYEMTNPVLCLLENGEIGIVCTIEANFTFDDLSHSGELTYVLTKYE